MRRWTVVRVEAGPMRWARSGRGHVAYRLLGDDGPVVLLLLTVTSDVDALLELPAAARFLTDLAEHCRVVLLDRRGTGPSDPLGDEESAGGATHAADAAAVLRDLDAGPAVVVGESYAGGPAALWLAAEAPDLVERLVVLNLPLRPITPDGGIDATVESVLWGASEEASWPTLNASVDGDEDFARWNERAGRATSPGVARRIWEQMLRYDLAGVLPRVHRPVTVVRTGHWTAPDDEVRLLADGLVDARTVEVPRVDTLVFLGDTVPLLDLLLHEATGAHRELRAQRALRALLLTDIVDSTGTAARIGDGAWRELLDRHDRATALVVSEHGGQLVKHTGDGVLATFPLASAAVDAAEAVHEVLAGIALRARAAVHVGEVELRDEDIGGIAVHVTARVLAAADPGETLLTDTVRAATIGSGTAYEPRGAHELRGVEGSWALWAVSPG